MLNEMLDRVQRNSQCDHNQIGKLSNLSKWEQKKVIKGKFNVLVIYTVVNTSYNSFRNQEN